VRLRDADVEHRLVDPLVPEPRLHGKQLVAQSKVDVNDEIFEWVAAKPKASR
jgi:hypothetical protein